MKITVFCLFLIMSFFLLAAEPLQEPVAFTWQDVFKTVILLVIAAAGAPITQLFKNLFKVQDRLALLLTAIVAALIAVLEMWLAGVLDFKTITLQNFPTSFFAVFSVATIYYALLKNSESVLGQGLLLKKPIQ